MRRLIARNFFRMGYMHLNEPREVKSEIFSVRVSISQRLGALTIIASCLILAMICGFLWHQWRMYNDADRRLNTLETFRATLLVMDLASAERASINEALGEDLPISPAGMAALRKASDKTDLAIEQLTERLGADGSGQWETELAAISRARTVLCASRARANRLLELPREKHTEYALDNAVVQMDKVVSQFFPIADAIGLSVVRGNASARRDMQTVRLGEMIRDQAELLGSLFTGALRAHRQLTPGEQLAIEHSYGRIDQLRSFIESRATYSPRSAQPALSRLKERYFGDGIAYVVAVRALASRPKAATVSTQTFVQQCVLLMRPIVDFRDEILGLVSTELKRQRDEILTRLIGACGIASVILSALLFVVWLFRQHVIRPLTEVTKTIVEISKGNLQGYVQKRAYRGEIQALFDAVDRLRAVILDRMQARDYASLIQRAILPDRLMQASLGENHFVLWKPRDVVGGDFYIYREGEDDDLIGVIDCAGHGVPGALMTMLAFAGIDQAIDSVQGHDPAAILQNTDTAMRAMLGRDQFNKALATSMDVGLVRIDRKRRCLIFSGARISLFASDGNEVREYKGGRRAIGDRRQGEYGDIEVPLQEGWTFYLCTDGFLDQAGGKHGFGFGTHRFTDMLCNYANRPLDEQARLFSALLAEYQGELPQRDDITLLSFRIN